MALKDLLYRCPFCARDPLSGEGPRGRCTGCGRAFEPGASRGGIRVTESDGRVAEFLAGDLTDRIAAQAPPASVLSSRASIRRAVREAPVRSWGGRLLGFAERFSRPVAGVLELSDSVLRFREDAGATHEWPLEELRALQGSSSEIQISPSSGGVVAFRMEDSTRRWEEALKDRIRARWSSRGRGEIVEFQPRIRGR